MSDRVQENRAKFPFAAQMLDELRKDFPNAKMISASENGHHVSRPWPPEKVIEPTPRRLYRVK